LGGNAVAGTFRLNRRVFDRWAELANLRADLHECSVVLSHRSGLKFDLSEAQLAAAHTAWKQDMGLWLAHLLPAKTKELNHLKTIAILLAKLCEFGVISVSGPGAPKPKRSQTVAEHELIPKPTPLPAPEVKKFKDGGCHYVAWLIAYHVCEFFEERRTDRIDAYESRLTEEFEMDMVSALMSAKVSAQSISLILSALFLRD
jgi:hypothetical protein